MFVVCGLFNFEGCYCFRGFAMLVIVRKLVLTRFKQKTPDFESESTIKKEKNRLWTFLGFTMIFRMIHIFWYVSCIYLDLIYECGIVILLRAETTFFCKKQILFSCRCSMETSSNARHTHTHACVYPAFLPRPLMFAIYS